MVIPFFAKKVPLAFGFASLLPSEYIFVGIWLIKVNKVDFVLISAKYSDIF